MKTVLVSLMAAATLPLFAQKDASIRIYPEQGNQLISKHIYGQFAEHLGTCIYGGLWVGPESEIPNTQGYRNDVLNALKELAGIDRHYHVISPAAIEPIQLLKTEYLGSHNPRLHTDEVLIALSTTAASDQAARQALEQLSRLSGCQAHTSVMLSEVDIKIFKRLGIQLTMEPQYENDHIYH